MWSDRMDFPSFSLHRRTPCMPIRVAPAPLRAERGMVS
jgi:hypothetical protein